MLDSISSISLIVHSRIQLEEVEKSRVAYYLVSGFFSPGKFPTKMCSIRWMCSGSSMENVANFVQHGRNSPAFSPRARQVLHSYHISISPTLGAGQAYGLIALAGAGNNCDNLRAHITVLRISRRPSMKSQQLSVMQTNKTLRGPCVRALFGPAWLRACQHEPIRMSLPARVVPARARQLDRMCFRMFVHFIRIAKNFSINPSTGQR